MILVAEHLDHRERRVVLEIGEHPVCIGRHPDVGKEAMVAFRIPWNDRLVNRRHSIARREGATLIIEPVKASGGRHAANRMYHYAPGEPRDVLDLPVRLEPGGAFVIGRQGRTAFHWLNSLDDLDRSRDDRAADAPGANDFPPADEAASSTGDEPAADSPEFASLDDYTLRLQLRLLQRELPEKVLSGWTDERELLIRAAGFLHGALPGQKGVAAAFLALTANDNPGAFELLSPDPSIRADFTPSRRLLAQLDRDAANGGTPLVWTPDSHPGEFADAPSLQRSIQWIAAVPVCSLEEDASIYRDADRRPVYLYVESAEASALAGRDGRAYLPFLRLIAALVASLLSARERQRVQDQMSAYFSPALRERLSDGDPAELEPSMTDCTVLFADRRGSSRVMETAISDDEILRQLRDNQEIVGEMTQTVFDHDGVITDFSGDGVLALWGWPRSRDSHGDHARLAVEATVAIARRLEERVEYDEKFERNMAAIRIGVSTGRLAVGKTGPTQQMHISVFGSVVNLGSRLEKIAKDFHVPALLSGETVDRLDLVAEGDIRVRRLCYIKPAGFEQSYPIFELILPKSVGGSGIGPEGVEIYERALKAFVERRWRKSLGLLEKLADDDRPARWLTRNVKRFQLKPPADAWQGEIVSLLK